MDPVKPNSVITRCSGPLGFVITEADGKHHLAFKECQKNFHSIQNFVITEFHRNLNSIRESYVVVTMPHPREVND